MMCEVGINDAEYQTRLYTKIDGKKNLLWTCPFYQTWTSMLVRCYSLKLHARYPTYAGCSVTKEWLTFSAFREWMAGQDWDGMELDKDILRPGNKVYSPDTCVFVPRALNAFLVDSAAARGEWPIGVYWDVQRGKFQSLCSNPFTGKRESLGRFACPDAAHEAWRARKHEMACAYADQQTDQRIATALRTRYIKMGNAK